jgi:hypothetical protein
MEVIHDGSIPAGKHNYFFNAGQYPQGLYFIDLHSEYGRQSQKIFIR